MVTLLGSILFLFGLMYIIRPEIMIEVKSRLSEKILGKKFVPNRHTLHVSRLLGVVLILFSMVYW